MLAFSVTPWLRSQAVLLRTLCRAAAAIIGLQFGLTLLAQSPFLPAVGEKTLLFMRVEFPDDPGESISLKAAEALMAEVDAWYALHSYGQMSFATTITPLLRLPRTKTFYQNNSTTLLEEARDAAEAAGFTNANFELDVVHFKPIYQREGFAWNDDKGTWFQHTNALLLVHELGHNLGLRHANLWETSDGSVIGAGRNLEYGDVFDNMGQAWEVNTTFNAYWKHRLGWLPPTATPLVQQSGLFSLAPLISPSLDAEKTYALRIRKDEEKEYWLEFREHPSNPWVHNGLIVHWSPFVESVDRTLLLDMTPNSGDAEFDAPLITGKTFSDESAGVHVTALGPQENGEMGVAVFLGTFAENRAPIPQLLVETGRVSSSILAQVQATDPDGDALAYQWDFFDESIPPSEPILVKSWPRPGIYQVQCAVSDMKGGQVKTGPATIQVINGNDDFLNATRLMGFSNRVSGTILYASRELAEPTHGDGGIGPSAWWRWTAPVSGPAQIVARWTGFEGAIGVYQGDQLAALREVPTQGGNARRQFTAEAGQEYFLAVASRDHRHGTIDIRLRQPWPTHRSRIIQTGTDLTVFFFVTLGGRYSVQHSTDLKTWIPLQEGVAESDFLEVTHPEGAVLPHRFYRLLE